MALIRHAPDLIARLLALRHHLHSLAFPPLCVGCNAIGADLCDHCAQAVEPVGPAICTRCGRTQAHVVRECVHCIDQAHFRLQMARAAALHQSPLREAIHAFKYEERVELAPLLARYLTAAFAATPWPEVATAIDRVVPVPLHHDRLKARGYNQAELLAAAFCRRSGLMLAPTWIQRVRDTPHQVGLNAGERRQNVQDAFVASKQVEGQTMLLIDDVYTTGATLNACAAAALDAGANRIFALTLAIPRNSSV